MTERPTPVTEQTHDTGAQPAAELSASWRATELVYAAKFVADAAEAALVNTIQTARELGADWSAIAVALEMDAEEARSRYEHADSTIYVDETTAIRLAVLADRWRCTLSEALTRVLTETLGRERHQEDQ